MQCDYFDAGACRSCTLMGQSYAAQLRELQSAVAEALADRFPVEDWTPAAHGPQSHFRNKAKLVVGGTRTDPTFGILDRAGHGVDLRDCGLYEPGLGRTVRQLADFVTELGLTPYDVPRRSGELKHLIVTRSPDGESMIRFVMRSPGQVGRLREALRELRAAVPGVRVVTVNLLPAHRAALEGEDELFLTEQQTLPMRLNGITLHLRPRSFFQTNTAVAAQLYQQAQQWISQLAPDSVLDLFCGVGGFALHAAKGLGLDTPGFDTPPPLRSPGTRPASIPGTRPASILGTRPASFLGTRPASVRGVEISADAVASANLSATELPDRERLGDIRFETGDATAALTEGSSAELVIVNPPRRGIGDLAAQLDRSDVRHVLYSSCNVTSLAADIRAMPSFRVRQARLFGMFPQSRHHEVLLLLSR